MKLIYEITYTDDKVEKIECTDFAYNQDIFWVFPMKGFLRVYKRTSSIQDMKMYFYSK